MKIHNKLVRDRIPEIIKKAGKKSVTHILSGKAYITELDRKLNEELSAADIMKKLGLSHRPTFRKNYLSPALESGLIERTIPDKPNSKNQKYRRIK